MEAKALFKEDLSDLAKIISEQHEFCGVDIDKLYDEIVSFIKNVKCKLVTTKEFNPSPNGSILKSDNFQYILDKNKTLTIINKLYHG